MSYAVRLLVVASLILYVISCALGDSDTSGPTGWRLPNFDESKVPEYVLPDPLVAADGTVISTWRDWEQVRRPEVLRLFEEYVYGEVPAGDYFQSARILSEDDHALGGEALRREIEITISRGGRQKTMDLLVYLPSDTSGPVPLFLGYNFDGNHTISSDPAVALADCWVKNNEALHTTENKATEYSRGMASSRWPVQTILERGYGLATMCYGDVGPDYVGGFQDDVRSLFYPTEQLRPADDEWGAIAGWAWGLSRALDYLSSWDAVDPQRVIVVGHSRLGKPALWAGATDKRFAMVVSNDSGCGGAALSRREFGETVKRINLTYPYWFCRYFHDFGTRVSDLPVDQHELIALIAPRPVYVASAERDLWSDPRGEYLSCYHAASVYDLYQPTQLAPDPPAVDSPMSVGNIGYHIRRGTHGITEYDWLQFIDFADIHLPG